jgi:hypothetical protein
MTFDRAIVQSTIATAAAAAALIMGAPSAVAEINSFTVSPGLGNGFVPAAVTS